MNNCRPPLKRSEVNVLLRHLIAVSILVVAFQTQDGNAASANFDCGDTFCTCDPNTPGDCDAMKKNCLLGEIHDCPGNPPICRCVAKAKVNLDNRKKVPEKLLRKTKPKTQ
jgi:hypothetical protein